MPGEAIAEAYHNFESGATQMLPMTAAAISNQTIQESMRLLLLVRAYQVRAPFASTGSPTLRPISYPRSCCKWPVM